MLDRGLQVVKRPEDSLMQFPAHLQALPFLADPNPEGNSPSERDFLCYLFR
jgi:hypothetical protein